MNERNMRPSLANDRAGIGGPIGYGMAAVIAVIGLVCLTMGISSIMGTELYRGAISLGIGILLLGFDARVFLKQPNLKYSGSLGGFLIIAGFLGQSVTTM